MATPTGSCSSRANANSAAPINGESAPSADETMISHNLADVFAVADRVTVLYLGGVAAEVKAADVTESQVAELVTAGRSGVSASVPRPPRKASDQG